MKNKLLVGMAIFLMIFGLAGVTYAIQFSGEIYRSAGNDPTGGGLIQLPYAHVGDKINIQVDYNSETMNATQIIVDIRSHPYPWIFYPTELNKLYFLAPNNWDYYSGELAFVMSGEIFTLYSEGFSGIAEGHVVPIPEPATLILVVIGIIGIAGVRIKINVCY